MNPLPTSCWRRGVVSLVAAGLVAATLPPAPAAAQVRLPALGESASADLSVGDERRIGDAIMREARRDPAYLDDPLLQEYLLAIWQPLLAAARRIGQVDPEIDRAFAWDAFLVKDRSVNAFALPGGYVGAHLGLIALTTTTDQLASVMAHELTHVTQRHIARSIAPQQQGALIQVVGALLAVLAASRANSGDAFNAAIMGSQGAAVQQQLNFSRAVEREADRIGFAVLVEAGFAPAGMAAMFDRLDQTSRLNDSGNFPYLRSHPLTGDRISEARNRVLLEPGRPSVPSGWHAMMQMRARVLMDDNPQALARLRGETSSPLAADRLAAYYGAAMAATLQGQHDRALGLAQQARAAAATLTPREPIAERAAGLLQVQALLARAGAAAAAAPADAARALALLEELPAAGASASPRPALLARAQAALLLHRAGDPASAAPLRTSTEALQTWVAEFRDDAAAWELLAATGEALGLRLRALRAAAESRAAVGDLTGAIDRLRAAQAVSRAAGSNADFVEASIIDTRLRQLAALRRQLVMEARGERVASRTPPDEVPPPAPSAEAAPAPVPAPSPLR